MVNPPLPSGLKLPVSLMPHIQSPLRQELFAVNGRDTAKSSRLSTKESTTPAGTPVKLSNQGRKAVIEMGWTRRPRVFQFCPRSLSMLLTAPLSTRPCVSFSVVPSATSESLYWDLLWLPSIQINVPAPYFEVVYM